MEFWWIAEQVSLANPEVFVFVSVDGAFSALGRIVDSLTGSNANAKSRLVQMKLHKNFPVGIASGKPPRFNASLGRAADLIARENWIEGPGRRWRSVPNSPTFLIDCCRWRCRDTAPHHLATSLGNGPSVVSLWQEFRKSKRSRLD